MCVCFQIRNRARQLRDQLEVAAGRHQKIKSKYEQTAEETEKYWQKVSAARAETLLLAHQKSYLKVRQGGGAIGCGIGCAVLLK